jgi:hypothetical protein
MEFGVGTVPFSEKGGGGEGACLILSVYTRFWFWCAASVEEREGVRGYGYILVYIYFGLPI